VLIDGSLKQWSWSTASDMTGTCQSTTCHQAELKSCCCRSSANSQMLMACKWPPTLTDCLLLLISGTLLPLCMHCEIPGHFLDISLSHFRVFQTHGHAVVRRSVMTADNSPTSFVVIHRNPSDKCLYGDADVKPWLDSYKAWWACSIWHCKSKGKWWVCANDIVAHYVAIYCLH